MNLGAFVQNFDLLTAGFLFLIGCIFGSFANVIILRLPRHENIAFPGSHCMSCGKKVAWYDNIPVISYFILRGKCRWCGQKFSWRYPLVEFLMGLIFCLIYLRVGLNWLLLEYLIFAFGLVTVTFIDFDQMILPDYFTISGIVLGLLGAWLNPERNFMPALWGVLFGGGFLWAIAYLYWLVRHQDGMGGGDIKLLAWIGAVLGWPSIPFVILTSSVVGSVVGITMAFRQRKGLQHTIPFGPYLALAAIAYILCDGHRIMQWYFHASVFAH